MKKYLLVPVWGVSLLMLGACGGEGTSNEQATGNNLVVEQATLAEAAVSTVVSLYLNVKDALVSSDEAATKAKAEELVTALEGAENDMNAGLLVNAKGIVEAGALEDQRVHFDQLSEKMYDLVKASEDLDVDLYKQYCPMAFNNEGAFWLSGQEEVRNPYFGDAMLTCGKVEEKIN